MNLANSILKDFLIQVGGGILFILALSLAVAVVRERVFIRRAR